MYVCMYICMCLCMYQFSHTTQSADSLHLSLEQVYDCQGRCFVASYIYIYIYIYDCMLCTGTLVFGEFSFKKRDTPPMVPPVPVAAQKASILPLV
jgi:hypothetical protein